LGAQTVRSLTLFPEALAVGGDVTLQRIRGDITVYMGESAINPSETTVANMMGLSIQLLPVINAAVLGSQVLDTHLVANQDSTNILWQQDYFPAMCDSTVVPNIAFLNAGTEKALVAKRIPFDVKVKRRFDRSTWRLALCSTAVTAEESSWGVAERVRALFLTSGGI